VEIRAFQKFLADGLTGSALEQDIVRHNNAGAPSRFEHRADVLNEIKLLVGCGRPEILPVVGEIVFFPVAFLVRETHGALLAKGWIGKHVIEGRKARCYKGVIR
jgi:hypothetical protein